MANRKTVHKAKRAPPEKITPDGDFWELRLYLAGQTSKSKRALQNLNTICGNHLAGRYRVEVIDLTKQPQLARGYQIVATPTLIRKLPGQIRQILGDLSNEEKTLVGLDLRPRPPLTD